jgi:hypothetical protein
LAPTARLHAIADRQLTVPSDNGANPGLNVAYSVLGMCAGADSIEDMALLRHGAMGRVFSGIYAPSTLGSFLRAFTFGHVRQLDAVASRLLGGLAAQPGRTGATPLLGEGRVLVDVDDTIVEVHGYAKQGAGFGYSGVRGLNALLATASTTASAPLVVAQRLRRGSCGSPRGARRLVADALATLARLAPGRAVLLRADSAFYGADTVGAAVRAGAEVSVTVRQDRRVKASIAAIAEDAWTPIGYRHAVFDQTSGRWISRAEVAEIPFTAFGSRPLAQQVSGRLVVRRIPELNPTDQDGLFDTWRFHAFFTTTDPGTLDTVAADKTHRGHAIVEQVHADLKNSALAHLPSGRFPANAAWLVLAVIAFNLTRTAACLTRSQLAKATTHTIRRTLISVPARVATSARRLRLHLPRGWPWQQAWTELFDQAWGPPPSTPT